MMTRIKKVLKNEKGFTLVELLAVIAILGIIVAIAVPSIGNVIGESENKADEANIELIENAARLADVSGDFGTSTDEDNNPTMTVSELKNAGYLEEIPEDPTDDSKRYSGPIVKNPDGTFSYDKDTTETSDDS